MDAQLAAFLAFTFVLVVTPGATTAIVVGNVLRGGRATGLAAALGAATANSTWAAAGALALAAGLSRRPEIDAALRFGGGGYLGYLGVRELVGAWQRKPAETPGALEPRGARNDGDPRTGFQQGLATNLLNPPIVAFYLTVVPSFLPAPAAAGRRYVLYAAIHVSMAFACHGTWAIALGALRSFWSKPASRRVLETLTGVALLGLAWRVLRT